MDLGDRIAALEAAARAIAGSADAARKEDAGEQGGDDFAVTVDQFSGEMPCIPFLQEMRWETDDRKLTMVCLLFVCGLKKEAQFVPMLSKLAVPNQIVRRVGQIDRFFQKVSVFVSLASDKVLAQALAALGRSAAWQLEFYSLGSLVRFPTVIDTVLSLISDVAPIPERADLLANLSYDDEQRYVRNLPFEFLRIAHPKARISLRALIRHLENGLVCDSLPLTSGPATLVANIAKGGRASPEFARIFAEIDGMPIADPRRKFASTLEDFLTRGIDGGLIAGWITEICGHKDEVAALYRSDATIRDPARARVLARACERK
jgi:hypothetical protein